jgi:enolase
MLIIVISRRIYNQFLRIEQLLGKNAVYAGLSALKKSK